MKATRVVFTLSALLLTAVFSWASSKQVLYRFTAGSDGEKPQAGLVWDTAGNLYGTTSSGDGGTGCNNGTAGCGTVFELSPLSGGGWTESVIYVFQGSSDGASPYSTLIFDKSGNLYGTTNAGGEHKMGTVFELSPQAGGTWTETVLHSFGASHDGYYPIAGVIVDKKGNLYGTTIAGGSHKCFDECGIVFELSPLSGGKWKYQVLYNFGATETDGANPRGNLAMDSAGILYGTTYEGGKGNGCGNLGCGTVFELKPSTKKEIILHDFSNAGNDGQTPWAGLTLDKQENLYGTTTVGGGSSGEGTVFELEKKKKWAEVQLYIFGSRNNDGYEPQAPVTFDAKGDILGVTSDGGAGGDGTVFKLKKAGGQWKESILHGFAGGSDGSQPAYGSLILDTTGNLYGTTSAGGNGEEGGTVFEVVP